MKVTQKLLENSILELTIEETAKKILKYRKNAVQHLQKNADIPGFRKGKAVPESVLLKKYGEDHIMQMTVDFAIDALYREALTSEKVVPVAGANMKEIVSQSPLKFIVEVEIFPEVTLDKKYKDVKLKKKTVKVTAAEVKDAITQIETRFTKFEAVTDKRKKAAMGDKVTVNTQGFDLEGKELANTAMQSYPLTLGSNILVPGFEEQIVGAKLSDNLELDVEFPADYHNSEFAGKKTKFKVEILGLEKAVAPEWTPEFIEGLRGKKVDMDGFKEIIKAEIKDTKEQNVRIEEEQELLKALEKFAKVSPGASMIAQQIEKVYAEVKQNIAQDGIKMVDYLTSLQLSEDEYKEKNIKPVALQRLSGELILNKIRETEKVEVTDAEMEKEIAQIMKNFESEDVLARLKDLYVPGSKYFEELRVRTSMRKVIESFFTK